MVAPRTVLVTIPDDVNYACMKSLPTSQTWVEFLSSLNNLYQRLLLADSKLPNPLRKALVVQSVNRNFKTLTMGFKQAFNLESC